MMWRALPYIHKTCLLDECDVFIIFQTCKTAFESLDQDVIQNTCLEVMKKDCRNKDKPCDVGDYISYFVKTHYSDILKVRYVMMKIYQLSGKMDRRKSCVLCQRRVVNHRDIRLEINTTWNRRTIPSNDDNDVDRLHAGEKPSNTPRKMCQCRRRVSFFLMSSRG